MKNSFKILMGTGYMALMMLAACKKNDELAVATSGKAGTLSASSSTLVLDKSKLDDTTSVISFSFTKANYGYSAVVTSTLQIDADGDNWANPTSFTLVSTASSEGFATNDFNSLLLKMGLPTGTASKVNIRVQQSISTAIAPIYSNIIALTVTPYSLITYVWAPGEYQNDTDPNKQWQPGKADSLVSPKGNGVYTGYMWFPKAGSPFKITSANDWNHTNYGDGGSGALSTSGGNISSPGAGLYLVTVDLNKNTISYSAYNHVWSVTGDASLGWGIDTDMAFVQNNNDYEVTMPLLNSGHFKFRADHDWTLSYGFVKPTDDGHLTSSDGGDIAPPATAGTYKVIMSFGDPLNGPTYKVVKP